MTTTPEEMYGVTKQEWIAFEQLRRSGAINMWGAREPLGMDRESFGNLLQHFSEMKAAWEAGVPERNPFKGMRQVTRLEFEGDDEEED